jgi:hypothetical protein
MESGNQQLIQMMQATKKKNQKSHVLNTGKKACGYWQQKVL